MLKRVIITIAIGIVLGLMIIGVIAYGRGYRFNYGQKSLTSTGIISASSYPDKASVWIDNKLVSATNASISYSPGWYNIRITREGYQPWEKKIRIQGEVVSQIDALLIPNNPGLRALTVTGVYKPVLSPTSTKVAYIISSDATKSGEIISKNGIWILDLRVGPLGNKSEAKQIYKPITPVVWKDARLLWSPDEKQVVLLLENRDSQSKKQTKPQITLYRVLSLNTDNDSVPPTDITASWNNIKSEWEKKREEKEKLQLTAIPSAVNLILKESAGLLKLAPDESKVLYLSTQSASLKPVLNPPLIGVNPTVETRELKKDTYYIYDIKEDRNYFLTDTKTFPDVNKLLWYTDSKHIVMIEKDTITIIDYDGTNKRTVYNGPFLESIVYPWPAGGQLVILTNLNSLQATPNLYELDLR